VIGAESPSLESLGRSLRETGYAVDMASNGQEGVHKAEIWDYDAIILDSLLPRRSGLEVLGDLRRSRATPIQMLGDTDRLEDRVRSLDSGADDYLLKPFELDELLARLRVMTRRAAGNSNSKVQIGDVLVDTASRIIRKAGKEVGMTSREYCLVEILALHRGKVVTRSMLYDHLQDENGDSLSNVLEVHICNIRRKLGKNFIKTRRGLGYLIEGP
jgi:two-component system OmpR family response regulator